MKDFVLHHKDCPALCDCDGSYGHDGHSCTCQGAAVMATLEATLAAYMIEDEPKRDAALRKLGLVR